MRDLSGRVAVITGGASGIGKAVAARLGEQGMSVVLADFEQAALDDTAREFHEREIEVMPVFADVADRHSVERLRDQVLERYGAVHVLMNNAGVADTARVPIWQSPEEDWDWVFKINFWGVLNGLRAFLPSMIESGEKGHVVNTASVAGLLPGSGIYGVSKHAVVALTESVRSGLQTQGVTNIGVSVLCPPFVKTRIFESARNRPGSTGGTLASPDVLERAIEVGLIADTVLRGIQEDQFYMVPASEFDGPIHDRFDEIIERRNP